MIYIYIYFLNLKTVIILLVLLCPPSENFAPSPKRKTATPLKICFPQHMGKNKKMAETNLLDIQWFLIQLNPSRIRMVSCLIFSANSWTPGKSSLCHALCDPFGTAACPVCHLALKIGAFNRRFWMFACFFSIMNKTHEHFLMIFVDFVLVNKIRRCIRISWNGRWNCRGFPGFFLSSQLDFGDRLSH